MFEAGGLDPVPCGFLDGRADLVPCIASRYNRQVIKGFRHKGLERFFKTGSKAGIQPSHASRLSRQLAVLNRARRPEEMNIPGWRLHPLSGARFGHWSVWVSGNWRLTFAFDREDADLVDYQDYH